MSSQRGVGARSPARSGPRPQVAAIAPPPQAPEHLILTRVRGNHLLDQLRHSDSALQVLRTARLVGDLAAITSTPTMSFADLLFQFMSGHVTMSFGGPSPTFLFQFIHSDRLQHRYRHSLQAVDIINDLCAQPLLLRDWFFSEEHCALTTRLLGAFTGFAGTLMCPPDPDQFFSTVSQLALLDEAPFLNTIFFLMLSRDLPPLLLNAWPGRGSATGQTIATLFSQSGDVTAKAFQIVGGCLRGKHTTWGQSTSP
jgi:hypothetical protein